MKKVVLIFLVLILSISLSGCSAIIAGFIEGLTGCKHEYQIVKEVPATCTDKGEIHKYCTLCEETEVEYVEALGHDMQEISRTEPVDNSDVVISYQCTRCEETSTETIARGSENCPYVLNADTWYAEHRAGTSHNKYLDKWVKVTGTVLNISEYSDLFGYYLVGGPGSGLICWVNSSKLDALYGQTIEFIGKVSVEDPTHIEINNGKVLKAEWPTEKIKSPITISDWSWTRDSVGGVEWNWRLTNNTDKIAKYITMEWYCYNGVGDLVYDEISRKPNMKVRYTGPLNPGETSVYLHNTTRFYSYSFSKSIITLLQVEFMDGTIIRITDNAYFDCYVDYLKAEMAIDNSGIKYIVNNDLNTCYVANIGTCSNTHVSINSYLSTPNGLMTITAIGDSAFENVSYLQSITFNYNVTSIGNHAFLNCKSLTEINFNGNIDDWIAIEKGTDWDKNTGEYIVYCRDGQILKDGTVIIGW